MTRSKKPSAFLKRFVAGVKKRQGISSAGVVVNFANPVIPSTASNARIIKTPNSLAIKKRSPGKKVKSSPFVASDVTKQQFFIPFKVITLNDVLEKAGATFRQSRQIKTNAYANYKKGFEKKIGLILKTYKIQPMSQAYFFFCCIEEDRRRDKDNISSVAKKLILDTLVKAEMLPNDGWAQNSGMKDHFRIEKGNPGILVEMYCPIKAQEQILFREMEIVKRELEEAKKYAA